MELSEFYISVDVETTGYTPGRYSMYQLGACCVNDRGNNFFRELKLLNGNYDPEALRVCNVKMEDLVCRGMEPAVVMREFAEWVGNTYREYVTGMGPGYAEDIARGRVANMPVFVGFNAPFDWMFTRMYFAYFSIPCPFGETGLDMKAYYMGMINCTWGETKKKYVSVRLPVPFKHTHNALDDAVEQAALFEKMILWNDTKQRLSRLV